MRRPTALVDYETEPLSLAILKSEGKPAITHLYRRNDYVSLAQPIRPPRKGGLIRHPQSRPHNAARATMLMRHPPIEESQIGAGRADPISVEKMVSRNIVLIDAFFDESQSERPYIKSMISNNVGRDRSEVMYSGELHGRNVLRLHNSSSSTTQSGYRSRRPWRPSVLLSAEGCAVGVGRAPELWTVPC